MHPSDAARRVTAEAWDAIDREADWISSTSASLQTRAETGFREVRTAALVADFFRSNGVQPQTGLALTGVRARLPGRSAGPTVAIMGELDGLILPQHPYADPDTGAAHACGHNAQLAAMLGAFVGLSRVTSKLDGNVVFMATPAEEMTEIEWRLELRKSREIQFLVGKPELIRLGSFDDVDIGFLTHTGKFSQRTPATTGDSYVGALVKSARFEGRASHAGSAPERGVNALKASTIALTAIEFQRELFRESDMLRLNATVAVHHGAPSVVPSDVQVEAMLRAATIDAMARASECFDRSVLAGAMAMGTRVTSTTTCGYLPHEPNSVLVELARRHFEDVLGLGSVSPGEQSTASTDVGDLGLMIPTVQPRIGGVSSVPHADDYEVVDHGLAAVVPAKAMVAMAISLLVDGARGAAAVMESHGPRMSKEEYLALRQGFDRVVERDFREPHVAGPVGDAEPVPQERE